MRGSGVQVTLAAPFSKDLRVLVVHQRTLDRVASVTISAPIYLMWGKCLSPDIWQVFQSNWPRGLARRCPQKERLLSINFGDSFYQLARARTMWSNFKRKQLENLGEFLISEIFPYNVERNERSILWSYLPFARTAEIKFANLTIDNDRVGSIDMGT